MSSVAGLDFHQNLTKHWKFNFQFFFLQIERTFWISGGTSFILEEGKFQKNFNIQKINIEVNFFFFFDNLIFLLAFSWFCKKHFRRAAKIARAYEIFILMKLNFENLSTYMLHYAQSHEIWPQSSITVGLRSTKYQILLYF